MRVGAAVAGVPGQHHGRHEDDRKAQPFQRKDARPAADAAAGDQAVDDDDSGFGTDPSILLIPGVHLADILAVEQSRRRD